MKISTKSKNAVAILSYLECFAHGTVVSMEKIEKALKISASYSAQILAELKAAGLADSKMGIGGGYFIPQTEDSEAVTVGDVCRAAEKDMYVVECVFDTAECGLGREAYGCPVREMMCDISDTVFEALDGIYISDIAQMLKNNGFVSEEDYKNTEVRGDEAVGKKQVWNAWLY